MPKDKITVGVDVKTVVNITDDGYLGRSASIDRHINKAVEDVGRWQWFVQKTPMSDPVPIQVRINVTSVAIIPGES